MTVPTVEGNPGGSPPARSVYIAYVDMDAYYVSCELRDRPELKDRPVIVGHEPSGPVARGVVLSASYAARRYGVHSALPSVIAARKCPEAVWIPPDFEKYERIAAEIRAYLARWSNRIVPLSIDEAALEAGGHDAETVRAWARELQVGVREFLRLPCSVGAHPSAIVAKIACDRAKPEGVSVVTPEETEAFLAPLPVSVIPGIGPKTSDRLGKMGVFLIGELARASPESLRGILGGSTLPLIRLARGTPGRELSLLPVEHGPRQRSLDRTFEQDCRDTPVVLRQLREMALELARGLDEEGLRFQTVSVRIRWAEFSQAQRGRQLPVAQEGPETLVRVAERIAREMLERERGGADRAVRRISLSTAKLTERRGRRIALERFSAADHEGRRAGTDDPADPVPEAGSGPGAPR